MKTTFVRLHGHEEHVSFWTSIMIALAVLTCSFYITLQPLDILVRHLKDDSFYYLKTANNIALGLGSTFDGINQTNGYHPLWMLNVIPIYWVFPHDPITALRVVMCIASLYHTIAALLIYWLLCRVCSIEVGAILSLAWALSPLVLRINLNGMESALYALVLMLFTSIVTLFCKDNTGRWQLFHVKPIILWFAGLTLGLCILARLDAVFLYTGMIVSVVSGIFLNKKGKRDVVALLKLAFPACILMTIYSVYNILRFGHVYPVSGLVKRPRFNGEGLYLFLRLFWPIKPIYEKIGVEITIIFVLTFILLLGGCLFWRRDILLLLVRIVRRYDWLYIGSFMIYAYISISETFIANWYYVPMFVLAVVSFAEVALYVTKTTCLPKGAIQGIRIGFVTTLVIAYIALATTEFNRYKNDTIAESLYASEWIKANIPEGTICAAWNAGVFAYFSERQVVNLDGLINSYAYYEAMQQGHAHELAMSQKVAFVFDMFPVPASGGSENFVPDTAWMPYLQPYYERRFYAHNVGLSSYFKTVFPTIEHDSMFMFKVWKVISP